MFISLLPVCGCDVIISFLLLVPCLSCLDGKTNLFFFFFLKLILLDILLQQ